MNFENREQISRRDDDTSKVAGERYTKSGKRSTDKGRILDWMSGNGLVYLNEHSRSLTSREIARDSGIDSDKTHKRLPDLARDGHVFKVKKRICAVTGEECWTWAAYPPEEIKRVIAKFNKPMLGEIVGKTMSLFEDQE